MRKPKKVTRVIVPKGGAAVLRNLRLLEGHHPGTMQERTKTKRKSKRA